MKLSNIFILLSICCIYISCGNSEISNRENNNSKLQSTRDKMWGEPIELTPKNKSDLEKDWVIKSGAWKVIDGKLESIKSEDGKYENIILFKRNRLGDYAIEFKARVKDQKSLDAGGDLSIILSADEKLRIRYDLQIGGLSNTMAIIQMYNLPLAQVAYEVFPSDVYKIRAEKIGDFLKLYCNDVLIVTCKNSYFLTGRFNGIYTYGEGKQFWDIKFFKKNMSDYEIELKAIDHILSKIISAPAKHRQHAGLIKTLFQDIIDAYPENLSLHDRVYLRIAHLELTLGNYQEVEHYLDRMNLKDNEYDISILIAKAKFMSGDFKRSKELFVKCFEKFSFYRVGTIGSIKNLLFSKQSRNITDGYKDFFWTIFVKHTLETIVNVSYANLKSIDFLKYKKDSLETVVANNNSLTSIAVLKDFSSLKFLSLDGNDLLSLKELNGLSIKKLSINENKIKSLEGIKLDVLENLDISIKDLKNLDLLNGCTNLKVLNGSKNELSDVSALFNLNQLKQINLSFNKINNISKIPLAELNYLRLQNNSISNIDILKGCKKLNYINIANNSITSIESLSKIESLETLICYNNPIISFKSFSKKPPKTFFFNIELLSEESVDGLLKSWSGDEYRIHRKNIKILQELKKGDKANIKQFAAELNGHYYLSVPVFLNKKNAQAFCKKFGGHLISIVEKSEYDEKVLDRMYFNDYWIGLEEVNGSIRWSTNESIGVDLFGGWRWYRTSNDKSYSIVMGNRWQVQDPENELPFIIEWDR
ncbi:MAG: hypothetical protein COA79_06525 [Planctomycetota bacterium]|nr:MAG: hypothetical protein COA79_06525 [Planctomycetota bacterium]